MTRIKLKLNTGQFWSVLPMTLLLALKLLILLILIIEQCESSGGSTMIFVRDGYNHHQQQQQQHPKQYQQQKSSSSIIIQPIMMKSQQQQQQQQQQPLINTNYNPFSQRSWFVGQPSSSSRIVGSPSGAGQQIAPSRNTKTNFESLPSMLHSRDSFELLRSNSNSNSNSNGFNGFNSEWERAVPTSTFGLPSTEQLPPPATVLPITNQNVVRTSSIPSIVLTPVSSSSSSSAATIDDVNVDADVGSLTNLIAELDEAVTRTTSAAAAVTQSGVSPPIPECTPERLQVYSTTNNNNNNNNNNQQSIQTQTQTQNVKPTILERVARHVFFESPSVSESAPSIINNNNIVNSPSIPNTVGSIGETGPPPAFADVAPAPAPASAPATATATATAPVSQAPAPAPAPAPVLAPTTLSPVSTSVTQAEPVPPVQGNNFKPVPEQTAPVQPVPIVQSPPSVQSSPSPVSQSPVTPIVSSAPSTPSTPSAPYVPNKPVMLRSQSSINRADFEPGVIVAPSNGITNSVPLIVGGGSVASIGIPTTALVVNNAIGGDSSTTTAANDEFVAASRQLRELRNDVDRIIANLDRENIRIFGAVFRALRAYIVSIERRIERLQRQPAVAGEMARVAGIRAKISAIKDKFDELFTRIKLKLTLKPLHLITGAMNTANVASSVVTTIIPNNTQ